MTLPPAAVHAAAVPPHDPIVRGDPPSGDSVVSASMHRIRSGSQAGASTERATGRALGQTLVEFSLVLPLFLVLLLGAIEFAFAFNASLSLGYASRDATLIAAESGNAPGGDCLVLQKVEEDIGAPADRSHIQTVEVYWSDQAGNLRNGIENVYRRSGSMSCTARNGSTFTLPYTATTASYPESARCTILAGCGNGHTSVDTIGVRVTYAHPWHTPLAGLLGWGGTAAWQLDRSNAMRMEPIL
jgi:TadE-like protein